MNPSHPINPPSSVIINEWIIDNGLNVSILDASAIASLAFRLGADQELEACCEWLASRPGNWESTAQELADDIRAARRPKRKSVKDQALAQTDAILNDPSRVLLTEVRETLELNRRALEQLDD